MFLRQLTLCKFCAKQRLFRTEYRLFSRGSLWMHEYLENIWITCGFVLEEEEGQKSCQHCDRTPLDIKRVHHASSLTKSMFDDVRLWMKLKAWVLSHMSIGFLDLVKIGYVLPSGGHVLRNVYLRWVWVLNGFACVPQFFLLLCFNALSFF